MLFSSITFLYFFLPLVIFLYFAAPQKGKNLVLFVMSLVFYAWGEPVYVLLMLAQIAVSYGLVRLMEKFKAKNERTGKILCILSVLVPFAALFYFKYFNFFKTILFLETIFRIETRAVALPVGISFYTFQIASYCVDVYRGRVECQKNFITYAAYVTLFPQLVAGPIVRYSEIERTLTVGAAERDMREGFCRGMSRFAVGLGKKVLMANVLGEFVAEVASLGQRDAALSWAYVAAVSLQIYFDFSGYSDMAIGLGSILGFRFPENFNYPFIAKSVSEFWRRWHITLGAWFRDYVYIPMGGNRVSLPRWMLNILVVWLFTGLWHGAGWNFIAWGLMFAILLVAEKGVGKIFRGMVKMPQNMAAFFGHIYLVFVVIVSFLVFHNDSLAGAAADIQALFSRGAHIATGAQNIASNTDLMVCGYLLRNRIVILAAGLVGATPLPLMLWTGVQKRLGDGSVAVRVLKCVFTIGLFVLCTAYLIDGSFNPFLYFRF